MIGPVAPAVNNFNPNGTSPIEWGSGAEGIGKWQQPASPDKAIAMKRGYYAAAAFSDSLLGELLDELSSSGLDRNTIVVVTSDHGWGLGEHNHWLKSVCVLAHVLIPSAERSLVSCSLEMTPRDHTVLLRRLYKPPNKRHVRGHFAHSILLG